MSLMFVRNDIMPQFHRFHIDDFTMDNADDRVALIGIINKEI